MWLSLMMWERFQQTFTSSTQPSLKYDESQFNLIQLWRKIKAYSITLSSMCSLLVANPRHRLKFSSSMIVVSNISGCQFEKQSVIRISFSFSILSCALLWFLNLETNWIHACDTLILSNICGCWFMKKIIICASFNCSILQGNKLFMLSCGCQA